MRSDKYFSCESCSEFVQPGDQFYEDEIYENSFVCADCHEEQLADQAKGE